MSENIQVQPCDHSCGVKEPHVHAFGMIYYGTRTQAQRAMWAARHVKDRGLREIAFRKVLVHIREEEEPTHAD